jgi:hypothetical protein
MDKKIEGVRIVIKSNVSDDKKDKVLSDKVNRLRSDTIEKFRELYTLFNCNNYCDVEFFYDVENKNEPFQITKLETDFVTQARIEHFFYERYKSDTV